MHIIYLNIFDYAYLYIVAGYADCKCIFSGSGKGG